MNRAICNIVFSWFSNTVADAAIAILLPSWRRFSCNGAVDWSTKCFCCESVLQKRWEFCDRSAWISNFKKFWQKLTLFSWSRSCSAWVTWIFNGRSEDLCVKPVERWLQIARVTQSGDAQNGDSPSDTEWRSAERRGLLSMASLTTAIFSGLLTVFTLPPHFFSVEPVA